ncbi:MAG TPA: PadR family transcriptional regulator [Novosphingobium sp.]
MRFEQDSGGRNRHGKGHGHGWRGLAMMARMGAGPFGGFGGRFADDFGDDEGGRGPRGRRGRMFGPGELRLLVLHLLTAGERHGYELIKGIEELTGGHYAPSPGVVYPTLSLLGDEGMIVEAAGEGARKAFGLTDSGRAEAAAREAEALAIVERLKAQADQRGRGVSPPVMRAMTNLKMALRQRAMAGVETETAHQIADILDEAARRIERL